LLRVYRELDEQQSNLSYSLCEKGCASCCSDYFNVPITEFFSVLYHLKMTDGNGRLAELSREAREKISDVVLPLGGSDLYNIPNFPPCLFVDNVSDECKVYTVRPVLCRMYGTVSGFPVCKRIEQDVLAKNALVKHNPNIDVATNIDRLVVNGAEADLVQNGKSHPLIYWFAGLDEKGELKTRKMRDLFAASYSLPINEFFRIIQL
jgi:Fe-S-cluster containining protein